jgi:hypothetical protein
MSSQKPIATTNEVIESAVIKAPLSNVWHFIKLGEFDKFWTAIKQSEHVKGVSDETNIVKKWTFQDGNTIEVKQDEHSVSSVTPQMPAPRLTHRIESRAFHHIQRHQCRT